MKLLDANSYGRLCYILDFILLLIYFFEKLAFKHKFVRNPSQVTTDDYP